MGGGSREEGVRGKGGRVCPRSLHPGRDTGYTV